MRYMMLVYSQETEFRSPEDLVAMFEGHKAVIEETKRNGIYRAADPLQTTSTATTVRKENGNLIITDGPFAETKEQLAGYYILECNNLDEAIGYAAKIPTGCQGGIGCIEIRPLREMIRPLSLA